LIGKGGHVRTVPIPQWVKQALDEWISAAKIAKGKIFRAVARAGKVWGSGLSENVVWYVVRSCCQRAGLARIAPHDLRRTCAKLCHTNGGELEQIQFLLGHASLLTTERYLGCKQNLGHPVNDLFDLKTNVQPQQTSPGSPATLATEVKAPADQAVNCPSAESDPSSGRVQERRVLKKGPHSVRRNNSDSTCSDEGFLTEWDGAA
jgi:hypothetical protein